MLIDKFSARKATESQSIIRSQYHLLVFERSFILRIKCELYLPRFVHDDDDDLWSNLYNLIYWLLD